jgi:glycosyltransferase involved in cell wall biosynthesis
MSGNSWQQEFNKAGINAWTTGKIGHRLPVPLINLWRLSQSIRSSDTIHILGYWNLLSIAVGFMARVFRKPYVLCPAGEFASVGKPRPIMQIFHKLVGRSLINNASGLVAITALERNLISSIAKVPIEDIALVPNGIAVSDVAFNVDGRLPEVPFILFMGRLASVKGPDLLIQAYINCAKAQRMPLVMAGPDFGMLDELKSLVEKSGLISRITFPGFLNEQERNNAYKKAAILVVPSRSEAMSLVALEAGAAGLPVLLTDACGFDEVENIRGGMVVTASVDGLSKGLEKMMDAADDFAQMGERLQQFVLENYTWTVVVNRMLSFFKKIINRSR